jgi:hypothetical protein
MSRLRHRLPLLAACIAAVVLLAPASRAAAQPEPSVAFREGTHAFRRILFDLGLKKPLENVQSLGEDPRHTLLVVLGETDVLDQLPGGLHGFLDQGGAALVATDRAVPARRLLEPFGFTVNGVQVKAPQQLCYHDLDECPLLQPPLLGSPLALFGRSRLPVAGTGLGTVATNRPSYVTIPEQLASGLHVVANLPSGCIIPGRPGRTFLPMNFGVGGKVGQGRLLVLADHSLFINEMMLQPDTDNVDFTYNCLDWLNGGERRTHALFVEEGAVQTSFDIPMKDVPVPIPPLDALVPLADNTLQKLEQENAFNDLLLSVVPFDQLWLALVLLVTGLLAVYGLYRLAGARHRVDAGAPLLEALLARQPAARSLMEQRHQALLGRGNLWEPARALARQGFEAAGLAPAAGRSVPPRVVATGGWWRRRARSRALRRLWQLAYGDRPVPVSRAEFARLPRRVEEVRAALASGALVLEQPAGEPAAPGQPRSERVTA